MKSLRIPSGAIPIRSPVVWLGPTQTETCEIGS